MKPAFRAATKVTPVRFVQVQQWKPTIQQDWYTEWYNECNEALSRMAIGLHLTNLN
jgi:hypothetical protein